MKHNAIIVFILIAIALMILNVVPVLYPKWANDTTLARASFAISIAGFITFLFHLISILSDKGEKAKGVVHNPAPVRELNSNAPCPPGRCSENIVCVIQITTPGDTDLKVGDLILYHNKAASNLCHGTQLDIIVKRDRIASFIGVGGAPISYGKISKR